MYIGCVIVMFSLSIMLWINTNEAVDISGVTFNKTKSKQPDVLYCILTSHNESLMNSGW